MGNQFAIVAFNSFNNQLVPRAIVKLLRGNTILMKINGRWNGNDRIHIQSLSWSIHSSRPSVTVGERTVALKIIACCSITQTPTGQWNIDNVAV